MNDLNYGDDNFNFDPSAFDFGGQVAPPQPGEYSITGRLANKTDRQTGAVVTTKSGDPVLTLQRVSIVDPENGQSFGLFEEISTGWFSRRDGKSGNRAIEALGSIDMELMQEIAGVAKADVPAQVADILKRETSASRPLRVKLGLQATDTDAAKAEISARNLSKETDGDEIRKVWNKYRFYTKAFKRADGKGYVTSVTSPSGNVLDARVVIDGFVPANKTGKSGPYYR